MNGQGVGSYLLIDSSLSNLDVGISTTLVAENSTSFLVQNTNFKNCVVAIQDSELGETLVAGGSGSIDLESWGFGRTIDGLSNTGSFADGDIPSANRTASLVDKSTSYFFTRNAPTYENIKAVEMVNIRSMGAKGDGRTDDTAIINQVLAGAANSSSVVFFPYGVYLITNKINIPIGLRVIGQA